ncbi:MAG TPA: hypothetical protein VL221_07825 [Bacteroidota bacterium]|nr:hypothetical protein [Bacteroidota bacterium]
MGKKRNNGSLPAGQGAWPTRDSLDKFIKVVSGVIPLLDSIRHSLEESTGSIPKVSQQLDNVTKATESATVEILDLLERLSARAASLGDTAARLRSAAEAEASRLQAMDGLMASLAAARPDIAALWREHRAAGGGAAIPADMEAQCGSISADAMSIGMALQVQDITTQQIAGVAHVIEAVRMNLADVLQSLVDGETIPAGQGDALPAGDHFNAEAQYSRSPDRQEHTDEIVERWKRGHHG